MDVDVTVDEYRTAVDDEKLMDVSSSVIAPVR